MLNPFSIRLVAWQTVHGRNDLPWSVSQLSLKTIDCDDIAYHVWLSEVMLQQTQVATVIPYFKVFIARFPTVFDLAEASLDEVLALWAGLGYYSRARHLHRCAITVVNEFKGIFPNNPNTLETLSGIGRSTAGAVASLAYNIPAAMLDGNVKRVLARHAGIQGWSGDNGVSKQLWQIAEQYLIINDLANVAKNDKPINNNDNINHYPVKDHHRRYTQGLMDLGAMVCHVKSPQCTVCPVSDDCKAFKEGLTQLIPTPRPKKTTPIQRRTCMVLYTDTGVWLYRRPTKGLWGGLFSFIEADSDPHHEAFVSLLNNTLNLNMTHADLTPWTIPTLKHTFTHYQLHWQVFSLKMPNNAVLPTGWQHIVWADIKTVGVPKAVLNVLNINNINLSIESFI